MTPTQVPVWLLDIDGVVNACTRTPDRSVWPAEDWVAVRVHAAGHSWPVLVARPVADFIRSVHEQGRAEIRWHTTWQHDAIALEQALDLPHLPVQDCPEFADPAWLRRDTWWKLPAAQRVLRDEGRALVWTDDDMTWDLCGPEKRELLSLGPALVIGPNELTGLTRKHLRQIDAFLTDMAPAEVTTSSGGGC